MNIYLKERFEIVGVTQKPFRSFFAPLAQLVEQLTLNQWVPGSEFCFGKPKRSSLLRKRRLKAKIAQEIAKRGNFLPKVCVTFDLNVFLFFRQAEASNIVRAYIK